jgi:hypothetical protein
MPESMDNELIRDLYRPAIIKLLFVGESAPVSGNFFYKGDSLTSHVQEAFEKAFEAVCRWPFKGIDPLETNR